MKRSSDNNLEEFIDAELRRLPQIVAPADLSEKIRSKIEARQNASWWQKPLWSWPPAVRVFAMIFFIVSAIAMACSFAFIDVDSLIVFAKSKQVLLDLSQELGWRLQVVDGYFHWLASPVVKPWVFGLLALGGTAYLLLICIGSAFFRFALNQKRGV